MSSHEITVTFTPICTCCGGELQAGSTEAKVTGHPFDRDNPLERTGRRVFVHACEKCFQWRGEINTAPPSPIDPAAVLALADELESMQYIDTELLRISRELRSLATGGQDGR